MQSRPNEQDWIVSWHPQRDQPDGTPHGAAAVCATSTDQLVLISHDGTHWGFPAGRPEGYEQPANTVRREVLEEACAVVVRARLLGYARSECVAGPQRGLVLVRSYWRCEVDVRPWRPEFEVHHRRIVAAANAMHQVRYPDTAATRIAFRALDEAGIGRLGGADAYPATD